MRSRTRSVKLPVPLIDAGERRSESLGYPSFNSYVAGLIRYDLMCRGPHLVTMPIAKMKLSDQDGIDDELLRIEESGEAPRGIFLAHLINRLVTNGIEVNGDTIAKEAVKKR
jgi:hypothetical protein